jgi:D-alanyl-D-alanine carboxypeptidase
VALACSPAAAAAERPPLPLRPDGHGVAQPTPPDLVDRRLPTRDLLPPPVDDTFTATIAPVPDDVLARSTWRPVCPVPPADLRYVTVVFRGFDGAAHTGELIVATRVAEDVAAVFGELFAAGFPIEEMRVVEASELTAPPTGDDNNTTAFVCRPAVGSTRWSAHALGLAVDVNPFQNPYRKGDLVLPELASAYLDRDHEQPGMIHDGGPVVAAFERIGWTWGGRWTSPVDLHHFSQTGT